MTSLSPTDGEMEAGPSEALLTESEDEAVDRASGMEGAWIRDLVASRGLAGVSLAGLAKELQKPACDSPLRDGQSLERKEEAEEGGEEGRQQQQQRQKKRKEAGAAEPERRKEEQEEEEEEAELGTKNTESEPVKTTQGGEMLLCAVLDAVLRDDELQLMLADDGRQGHASAVSPKAKHRIVDDKATGLRGLACYRSVMLTALQAAALADRMGKEVAFGPSLFSS